MTGAQWVFGWILFLVIGLIGAAIATSVGRKTTRTWLAAWMLVGAVALALMGMSTVAALPQAPIVLPPPWPALQLAPLPLAPLWAWIAALLFAAAALASLSHPQARHVLYALLPLEAGVGIYLWSGDGLLLLVSWEFLSALTYLGLVTTRRARPVWRAGWVLLALSELGGMLLLVGLVWLMPVGHGSLNDAFPVLSRSALHAGSGVVTAVMVLALLAFGVKAGLFPVMIWMPLAEPEAPGVVAGIFSGLLTALAISGILALDRWLHPGMAWGVLLLVLGVLGAITGALYSVISRHVKRVLAYSTLEILGLVFAALGIWHIVSLVSPASAAGTLALDGAIVLLVMHAGAKFIVFAVTDHTGRFGHTLDRLGGIVHGAPRTSGWTLLGVVTLAGFPPLGGFVGEWLLLESILKPLGPSAAQRTDHLALLLGGAFLAMAIALGVASYLRWYGFIFLGPLRQSAAVAPSEAPWPMRLGLALPMALPLLCGPAVPWFLPWLNHQISSLLSTPVQIFAPTQAQPQTVAPLVQLGGNLLPGPGTAGTIFYPQGFSVGDPYVLLAMGLVLAGTVAGIRSLARRRFKLRQVDPWNGGLAPFEARTSYSAEGFAHPLRLAFAAFYGLQRERIDTSGARFYRHTIVYRLEEHLYQPFLAAARWTAGHVRRIQSGQVSQYVAYVWIAVLISMLIGTTVAFNSHI